MSSSRCLRPKGAHVASGTMCQGVLSFADKMRLLVECDCMFTLSPEILGQLNGERGRRRMWFSRNSQFEWEMLTSWAVCGACCLDGRIPSTVTLRRAQLHSCAVGLPLGPSLCDRQEQRAAGLLNSGLCGLRTCWEVCTLAPNWTSGAFCGKGGTCLGSSVFACAIACSSMGFDSFRFWGLTLSFVVHAFRIYSGVGTATY